MKKLFACLLALALLLGTACAEARALSDRLLREGITPGMTPGWVTALLPKVALDSDGDETGSYVVCEDVPVLGMTARCGCFFVDGELRLALFTALRGETAGVDRAALEATLTDLYGEPRVLSQVHNEAVVRHAVDQQGGLPVEEGLWWQLSPITQVWLFTATNGDCLAVIASPEVSAAAQGMDEWLLSEGITPAMTKDAVSAAAGCDGQEVALGETLFVIFPQSTLKGVAAEAAYVFEQGKLSMVNYTAYWSEGGASPLDALRTALTQRLGEGRTMPMTDMACIMYGAEADLRGLPDVEGLAWQLSGTSWLFLYEVEDLVYAVICPAAQ